MAVQGISSKVFAFKFKINIVFFPFLSPVSEESLKHQNLIHFLQAIFSFLFTVMIINL